MSTQSVPSSPHTSPVKAQMQQLIDHLREDVKKTNNPKAQALFETSAEVLTGLVKAFTDFEQQNEPAWQASNKSGTTGNTFPPQETPVK